MPGDIYTVVGGQYGSEAKGHVAAQLHRRSMIDNAVRVGGPNAGHTVIDSNGVTFALRSIPVAAAVDPDTSLWISAQSEIDIEVLFSEIDQLETAGHDVTSRLYIDGQATVITDEHKRLEAERLGSHGSTQKGIGAARAARIMREAPLAKDAAELRGFVCEDDDTQWLLQEAHSEGESILIEGTQGYWLGSHAGLYPFCTTNNCRGIDTVAQVGLAPLRRFETWLVFRTYPIRIAGNSGPIGRELDWQQLSEATDGYIQPERTTVTKKIRRVAEWDGDAAAYAVMANGGPQNDRLHTALMFVDYLDPSLAGCTSLDQLERSPAMARIEEMEDEIGMAFSLFGTGPDTVVWR